MTNSWALRVPGLASHTCGRIHGFLGRVVSPIIERRRQLKQKIQFKGDHIDRQQNVEMAVSDLFWIYRLQERPFW